MKQIIIFLLALACATTAQAQVINLSGPWQCTLLDDAEGKPLPADKLVTTTVRLPGTTDTNGLGYAPADTTETTHLTRLHAYRGRARYERDIAIPRGWTLRGAFGSSFSNGRRPPRFSSTANVWAAATTSPRRNASHCPSTRPDGTA